MKKLDLDENKLRQLHADDVTLNDIAAYFGCDKTTIDRRCRKLGLKKKRTGPKNGDKHPSWTGGTTIRKGYRYIYAPWHPNAIRGQYVAEHRLVMEDKLQRFLLRSEVVHHIDGVKLHNHPDNLELFESNAAHLKHELTGKVPNWTEDGKLKIREAIVKAFELRDIDREPVFCDHLAPQPTDHHQE